MYLYSAYTVSITCLFIYVYVCNLRVFEGGCIECVGYVAVRGMWGGGRCVSIYTAGAEGRRENNRI